MKGECVKLFWDVGMDVLSPWKHAAPLSLPGLAILELPSSGCHVTKGVPFFVSTLWRGRRHAVRGSITVSEYFGGLQHYTRCTCSVILVDWILPSAKLLFEAFEITHLHKSASQSCVTSSSSLSSLSKLCCFRLTKASEGTSHREYPQLSSICRQTSQGKIFLHLKLAAVLQQHLH